MKCNKCHGDFPVLERGTVGFCPYCGAPVFSDIMVGKESLLHEMLLSIAQQFGSDTLGHPRLKGLLADLMPHAEKRHLRIFKQAVDDGLGARLLEMQSDTHAVRTLKITTLKENFRNNNAFNHTADYVVDCFLFALGWQEGTPIEKTNHVTVDSLNILNQQVDLAFSDGKLTKDESKSLFLLATSLNIPESQVAGIIQNKIDELNLTSESPIDSSSKITKEFICSHNWIESKNFAAVTIGNQVWMKKNLDVIHFRNGDPIPEARKMEEWKAACYGGKPAWCYYANNPLNEFSYGKLYNWHAVNDPRGLAPEGWDIPGYYDFKELLSFYEKNKLDCAKMIDRESNLNATNDRFANNLSCFSGMPGGIRNMNYDFFGFEKIGNWWSSSEYTPSKAFYFYIDFMENYTSIDKLDKDLGLSVRCVKQSNLGKGSIDAKSNHIFGTNKIAINKFYSTPSFRLKSINQYYYASSIYGNDLVFTECDKLALVEKSQFIRLLMDNRNAKFGRLIQVFTDEKGKNKIQRVDKNGDLMWDIEMYNDPEEKWVFKIDKNGKLHLIS